MAFHSWAIENSLCCSTQNCMYEFNFATKTWSEIQARGLLPSVRSCPAWAKDDTHVYIQGELIWREEIVYTLSPVGPEHFVFRVIVQEGTTESVVCQISGRAILLHTPGHKCPALETLHRLDTFTAGKLRGPAFCSFGGPFGNPSTYLDFWSLAHLICSCLYGNKMYVYGGYSGTRVHSCLILKSLRVDVQYVEFKLTTFGFCRK